jgi:hypothetical protein
VVANLRIRKYFWLFDKFIGESGAPTSSCAQQSSAICEFRVGILEAQCGLYACGINDSGHIFGRLATPSSARAFLFRDEVNTDSLFGGNSSARVVGIATTGGAKPAKVLEIY